MAKLIKNFPCVDVNEANDKIQRSKASCVALVVIPAGTYAVGRSRTEARRNAQRTEWKIIQLNAVEKIQEESLPFGPQLEHRALKKDTTEVYVVGADDPQLSIMKMGFVEYTPSGIK